MKKRHADVKETDGVSRESPLHPSNAELRCEQLERELEVLRNSHSRLANRVQDVAFRLEVIEPEWASKKYKQLRADLDGMRSRCQAMANRMIVMSEVAYFASLRGPQVAVQRLKDLLRVWDESDDVWTNLASIPLGEWIDTIASRVIVLRSGTDREQDFATKDDTENVG